MSNVIPIRPLTDDRLDDDQTDPEFIAWSAWLTDTLRSA